MLVAVLLRKVPPRNPPAVLHHVVRVSRADELLRLRLQHAFTPDADLGRIAGILELSSIARIGCSIAGFFALRTGARVLMTPLLTHAPHSVDLSRVATGNAYLVQAAVIPWVAGVVLVLPFAFPVPHWLSLFYVVVAGLSTVFATEFSKQLTSVPARSGPFLERVSALPAVAYVAMLLTNVFVLVPGISLTR